MRGKTQTSMSSISGQTCKRLVNDDGREKLLKASPAACCGLNESILKKRQLVLKQTACLRNAWMSSFLENQTGSPNITDAYENKFPPSRPIFVKG